MNALLNTPNFVEEIRKVMECYACVWSNQESKLFNAI
jgi:hypothetical protein